MAQVKNERTRVLADDLIGAAQILEKYAKALREDARIIRQYGLHELRPEDGWTKDTTPTQNQRMHKAGNIQHACQQALQMVDILETGKR